MHHLDLADLLQTILNRAVQLVRARDGFVFLADRSGQELEMAVAGRTSPSRPALHRGGALRQGARRRP